MATRKDYQMLADVLRAEVAVTWGYQSTIPFLTVRNIVLSMADKFKQDNERFDREVFYLACGLTKDGFEREPN